MSYARIQDNTVVEIVKPVDGFSIQQCFHPDLLKSIFSCPDNVQVGWSYDADTGAFTAPSEPEVPVEPEAPVEPPAE